MVSDGPGERRRFLDILLSLSVPTYLSALQRFRKILQHRNAALKAGAPDDHVRAWDHGLTESAGVVTAARARWIAARGEGFGRYHRIVSGGDSARMVYDPSVQLPEADEAPSAGAAAEAYADALHGAGDRDRRQGFTTAGPHRDDLKLVLDRPEGPLDIREYGSGGQRRTAALALRLVEADTLRDSREREPIILLDDVFAELDEGRSRRVLELIERSETGQVILTAPKESDVRIRRDSLPRWCIEKGVIRV